MKKLVSMVLLAAMLLTCSLAMADTGDIARFADYTDVDVNVFISKGYSCYYDDFEFSAEISPQNSEIKYEKDDDTYKITMDIKVLYSSGHCTLIPRLIFRREGWKTYFDDRMSDVYIRNGGNRYIIDTTGCSRSTSSKNYTATDSSVEPMYNGGLVMLEDLALHPMDIEVKMGSYCHQFYLTADQKQAIKTFYEDCKEAGVFDQAFLLTSDDYSIRTLFNENSVDAEETVVEEEPAPDPQE